MTKGKRTNHDFSKHKLTIKECEHCIIHILEIQGSSTFRVVFINSNGILAVTGDFYNWIFSREFIPKKDETVSDQYWAEKLQISSGQKAYLFDAGLTEKKLQEKIDHELEDYGYEGEELQTMKDYYSNCFEYVHDDNYKHKAYEDLPDIADYSDIVFEEKIDRSLEFIFDAFEIICSRL